ncbi:N-methyl-L-tryptophan oxidase [Spirillospora sp. CA-128828]|uniref:N-methyl-L-tryptophan oxidase n=1 Tax=Spirillospora sp. CA-128828 TaxID=3240033 RepID=UPI003D8A08CA
MTGPIDAETGVIGVGTVGAALLWQLARRGVPAIGFERYAPGHDRAAVGGESRLFRVAYAEGARYTGLLRRALGQWRELEAAAGVPLLGACGGLSIGLPEQDYIRNLLASAQESGTPVEVLDRPAMRARYPQHRLLEGEVGVLDEQAGFLRCETAVVAAADQAERHGARVLRRTEIDVVVEHDDHVEIRAGEQRWRVRQAVLCAGSWTGRFLPDGLRRRLRPHRLLLTWFLARRPEEYTPGRFPIFIRESAGVHLYGAPSLDGAGVKVAGAVPAMPVPDPDAIERRHSRAEIAAVSSAVAELLLGLHPDPIRADAFTDLYTPDGDPLVGRIGGGRLSIASGFSGRGFKYASALAADVADMLADGTGAPLDFMAPERFAAGDPPDPGKDG